MKGQLKLVRRDFNSRVYRPFARSLPWPYNGMVNDLVGCIREGGNYLAALGLASYTEICGRQILFNGDNSIKAWCCYNEIIKYMGAGEVLQQKISFEGKKIYFKDAVRNGFVHRYFMKIDSGGVAMLSSRPQPTRCGFLVQSVKGQDYMIMVVVPYFRLFCQALKRAKREGKLKWH